MFGFSDVGSDDEGFDLEDEFVPEHLPEPGPFLTDHDVLTGDDHLAFHRVTRECFEERGVYDMTFGYNLARLNRDRRHPDAGYRYAEEVDVGGDGLDERGDEARERGDGAHDQGEKAHGQGDRTRRVLRAEFTPTTPFCPQSDTLALGSARAWNGLSDRHGYDLVRVRVAPMHHASEEINATIERLESRFVETGSLAFVGDPSRSGSGFDGVDHGDPAEDAHF